MLSGFSFIVSCEHASAAVPARWKPLLAPYLAQCEEHQLWDPGAAEVSRELARLLRAPFFSGETTRLLVDLNRSLTHADIFSPPVLTLPPAERTDILCRHYYPYRHRVRQEIEGLLAEKRPVVHLSIHSFTPAFEGETRANDLGLLFDPWRKKDNDLAEIWLHYLQQKEPALVCAPNQPYLGISDGHVPVLRKLFRSTRYFGFELEFNQRLPLKRQAPHYARWLHRCLKLALESKAAAHVAE